MGDVFGGCYNIKKIDNRSNVRVFFDNLMYGLDTDNSNSWKNAETGETITSIANGVAIRNDYTCEYTINLNPNGGTVSESSITTSGMGKVSSFPRPKYDGMQFKGWYTAAEGGERVTTSTVFSADATIYAHWGNYDENNRVTITSLSPQNGDRKVDHAYGGVVHLKVSFKTSVPISDIDTDAGQIHIYEYNTDEEIYSTNHRRLIDVKSSGSESTISFDFMYSGLNYATKYYIVIDEGFLIFEDESLFAFVDKDEWVFKTKTSPIKKKIKIRDEYYGQDKYINYDFCLDDEYFDGPATEYDHDRTIWAYGLAMSGFSSYRGGDSFGYQNAEEMLEEFGFSNDFPGMPNDYFQKEPKRYTFGTYCASKHITVEEDGVEKEYTLIAVATRGAGYTNEWYSNAIVGTEPQHEGFRLASDAMFNHICQYIKTIRESGDNNDIKIIMAGYSRAAAVTNLTAARIDEGKLSDKFNEIGISVDIPARNIYAYCFEPPTVTREYKAGVDYDNITNIINPADVVPMVPFKGKTWKFGRYGKTYYLPSTTTDSKTYGSLKQTFLKNHKDIFNVEYDNSAFYVWNKPLERIAFWLPRVNSTVDIYIPQLIDDLSSCIKYEDYKGIETPLAGFLQEHFTSDSNSGDSSVIIDFLIELVVQLKSTLIDHYKTWKDNKYSYSKGLVFQEHEPSVNFTWLTTLDGEEDFNNGVWKGVYINCPVNASVYNSSNELVAQIIDDRPVSIEGSFIECYVDENGQKVIILPEDDDFNVVVEATGDGKMDYSVAEYSLEEASYVNKTAYYDVPISSGDELKGQVLKNGNNTFADENNNTIEPSKIFENVIPRYEVVTNAGENGETVGPGTVQEGNYAQIVAVPNPGADFVGWYDMEENLISEDAEYRFRGEQNVEDTAKFKGRDGLTAVVDAYDLTYTGTAQKPEVKVYDGVSELTYGKDYTIAYKNNTNVYTLTEEDDGFDAKKAPTVTVTGKGNYSGKDVAYFTIQPKSLKDEDVTVDDILPEITDGKDKKPIPKVKWGKKALANKKDYTIEYLDEAGNTVTAFKAANTEGKHYTVRVTGTGNYTGVVEKEYVIVNTSRKLVSKLAVTINNLKYEDRNEEGEIKHKDNQLIVKDGGNVLKENTDYTLSYADNKDIGTASVTITGMGDTYYGTKTVTFKITGNTLSAGFIKNFVTKKDYNGGTAVEQDTVKLILNDKAKTELKGKELSEYEALGEDEKRTFDYTYEYQNNVNPGKATVIYRGVNSYSGEIKKTYTINGIALSSAVIDKDSFTASVGYTGAECKQDDIKLIYKVSKNDPGTELRKIEKSEYEEKSASDKLNYDYIYEYQKNEDAGTATMILTGVNKYTGTVNKTFKITPYDIDPKKETSNLFTVTLEDDDDDASTPVKVAYTKGKTMPEPIVKFGAETLTKGRDYAVAYVNNTKIADASDIKAPTVKVTGKGNFKGIDQSCTFSIVSVDIGSCGAVMTIPDKVAVNGEGNWISMPVITDVNGNKLAAGTDYCNANDKNNPIAYYKIENGTETKLEKTDIVGAGDDGEGTTIKVVVTGKGAYSGTIEGTYRIVAKDISKVNITIKPKAYTGKKVSLSTGDFVWKREVLTMGEDFEIVEESYANNVKKGSASVTIKGIGNYGGTKTIKYTIGARSFLWWFRNLIQ
ncbi:MAG: InlB B-repeat-containing protein [Lachnospiraceae bacterium]|nr:InlB B-repeat-containing protein [Lachnospiraceae bacterium]